MVAEQALEVAVEAAEELVHRDEVVAGDGRAVVVQGLLAEDGRRISQVADVQSPPPSTVTIASDSAPQRLQARSTKNSSSRCATTRI